MSERVGVPARDARFVHRPHTAFGHDDDDLVLRLVSYRAEDGHRWDAMLARPRRGPESPALAVVVHGEGDNYLSGIARRLAFELARLGHPALSVNTRMANFGAAYGGGRLDLVPRDLAGALDRARRLGFERFVLVGHRAGAAAVLDFQATRAPADVVAVAAVTPDPSVREAARERWSAHGAEPPFDLIARHAAPVARGERADDIVCVRRAGGPSDAAGDAETWTYRTWWACHGPEARHAVPRERLPEVRVPVLIVQSDDPPGRRRGEDLVRARPEGTALRLIPGAGPELWGAVPAAADAIRTWADGEIAAPGGAPRAAAPGRAGIRHRLLTLVAHDGTEHDALMHDDAEAEAARGGARTAVLHVHGNQGNFTVGTLRFLPEPVVERGIAMLVVETRLANASQLVGHARLPDALADLEAAAEWLAGQGYARIVLSGYSLGSTLAVRLAADNPRWLAGLMTFGADWSLPEATRTRMALLGSEPSYAEMVERCRSAGTDGPVGAPDDPLLVVRRAFGAEPDPRHAGIYTARAWWSSRGPEAEAAEPGRHIGAVRAPVLLVQGTDDAIADPSDAARLAEEARRGGNEGVRVAMVEGVGHGFRGGEERVIEAVSGFLADVR